MFFFRLDVGERGKNPRETETLALSVMYCRGKSSGGVHTKAAGFPNLHQIRGQLLTITGLHLKVTVDIWKKKKKKKIHCWQFVMNQWIKTRCLKTLALCAFLHIHHIRPLGGILLSKMNRQINNYYHTCRISQKASLKTLFSLLGLMFVDTTSSHRKWFVNNTLPVTSAKSVQTDGDLLHGWRVQLFWRLSSGRTKRFLAAGWILQPPRNRSLLFKHQVQGLFHPLRWSLQTIIKTQNGAKTNTVLSCCTTIGFIGPSPNETDCSDVKRCFVLNSEVNTSWRTSSSNFSKKWPLLLQWKNSGFLNTAFYKLKCFDLGRNKWLGRLKEKNCT